MVPDRSESGPYLRGLRAIAGIVRWGWDSPGRFWGRAIFSESAASVVPDRSESGPYLGGPRAIAGVLRWGWRSSMGRAKAELPEKMEPYDQSALGRETWAGEPEPDGLGTSGSVHFQPQYWVCLLWRQRGIVFVRTTNAARRCLSISTASFRLSPRENHRDP